MVEVFKTNVNSPEHAHMLLDHIHNTYVDYSANFDLEDCDRILRVKSNEGPVQPFHLINLLSRFGFNSEVLPD
ncbi:hypothetical protein [Chitinophaga tropicalis]|uniref:Uncharacterized protein n=1 Tax=Chitinophaga tropicalis TaxID=2683588 RepID=A0A7K1U466_9BACT|nr:hypothetical protein [Chitinophaga tropicalis]MVT09130.1 hypothetical protein [Chitinophaga tropicalis]